MRRRHRWGALAAATVAAGLALGSCSAPPEDDPSTITVWTLENLTERMTATQRITDRFTEETGIQVELVAVEENQLSQMVMSAAAAGRLPDVIAATPLSAVRQMASNDLLDTRAAGRIVDDLDPATFHDRALDLTTEHGERLAVPSDAWAQVLVYRTDLFAKAGLPAPTSYADITKAARALDQPGMHGISLATDPDDAFTQQSFEYLALANGCQLVRSSGRVDLDSPACRRTFSLYKTLTTEYSASGAQNVDSTRATYFAGRSAMVVWSTLLLDELAGLREDAMPSCAQCAGDRQWLADHSAVVGGLRGPDGDAPAQFGEVTSWAVPTTANEDSARKFVTYMMDEGYTDWFGMAPEGKYPARGGTPKDPHRFEQAWEHRPAGLESRQRLSDVYPDTTIDQERDALDRIERWGIPQGQGDLVGATLGELPIPTAVNAQATGQLSPVAAARQADQDVTDIQSSLR